MAKTSQDDTDDLDVDLYSLGLSLGFSLAHVRRSIEGAKSKKDLHRKWGRLAGEEVRFLAYASAGRGDYTNEFWKSMTDEPEPVDDSWLAMFSKKARGE